MSLEPQKTLEGFASVCTCIYLHAMYSVYMYNSVRKNMSFVFTSCEHSFCVNCCCVCCRFIYETESFNGIGELLEILGR